MHVCVCEQRIYSMDHRPRGRVIVISNHYFLKPNLELRDGAEFDEENVCSLFTKLDFDAKLYRNKTASVCLLICSWFLHCACELKITRRKILSVIISEI